MPAGSGPRASISTGTSAVRSLPSTRSSLRSCGRSKKFGKQQGEHSKTQSERRRCERRRQRQKPRSSCVRARRPARGGAAGGCAMTGPKKLSLEKALHLLRKPDVRLVRLHSNNGGAGFYVWPGGGRVPDEVAQQLLGRRDIQPYDSGLFPGHPQSWPLGNRREWAGRV